MAIVFHIGYIAKIAVVLCSGVLIACVIIVTYGFGGNKLKYSGPSNSSNAAKWQKVFICNIEIKIVEASGQKREFRPKEAWVEFVVENLNSFPKSTRKAGKRICIRFDRSSGITSEKRVTIEFNGKSRNQQYVWDRSGVTFGFEKQLDEELPPSFTVNVFQTESKQRSLCEYTIHLKK
ncbi:hypothetical protein [Schlesneria paludicola]|uniref:hypothetical protein n=1 Tax=Schlesneria paludicola TaxID=360056 RepID=UPI00029A1541|nr:hypothetical protein [Schlesneria paludicola]